MLGQGGVGVCATMVAHAFGAPVIIDARLRDGSLRAEAVERGLPVLLYEGGQAMRFDEDCIRVGVRGIRDVMRELDMLPKSKKRGRTHEPVAVQQTSWVRAPTSGVLRAAVGLGERVARGQVLGVVGDPFGEGEAQLVAPCGGVVIGHNQCPLVHEGDAAFNIARIADAGDAVARIDALTSDLDDSDLRKPDEAPVI